MAVVITERPDSRPINYGVTGGSQVTRHNVRATAGEDDAAAFLAVAADSAECPSVLNGLVKRNVRLDPLEGHADRWTAEVEYGPTGVGGTTDPLGATSSDPAASAPSQAGTQGDTASTGHMGAGYSFDISAETSHVTFSLRQMGRIGRGFDLGSGTVTLTGVGNVVTSDSWASGGADVGKVIWITYPAPAGWYAGGYKILAQDVANWTLDRAPARTTATGAAAWVEKETAADYGGAIGVTSGEIKGVDVYTPRFTWTRAVSRFALSRAYVLTLRGLVGTKNDRPFYGSMPGEVLYMGCTGTFSVAERWSLSHRFSEIASTRDIVVDTAGELVVPYKRGWDYLWVDYEEYDNAAKTKILIKPRGVYVEEVYPNGDFTLIGIGR